MVSSGPPAYAWDWLARQRIVWQECRRRLLAADPEGSTRHSVTGSGGDVPDWARDHPDLVRSTRTDLGGQGASARDYRALDTRADVIGALRADYPHDRRVRGVVDAVVGEVAFLGRLDVSLAELGVRSAPRGMRWWWSHLTGRPTPVAPSESPSTSEPAASVPLQLRLVDVLSGYGDATEH